jgi:hypothetical protein
MLGNEVSILLVGTKHDLKAVVSAEDIAALCAEVKAEHVTTSARLDEGVEEAFLKLSEGTVHP